MFNLRKFFSSEDHITETLRLLSTNNIKQLEDIRIFGHFKYPDYTKIFQKDPDGVEIQFSNFEEEQAYARGKISSDDMWKYKINRYNFRDDWDFSETNAPKIACFGDSFTFGDGVRSEHTYVNLLGELLGSRTYNVGKGGSCVERVTRTFSAFTRFVDIDVAVITLPHIHREFFIDEHGFAVDLIPNIDSNNYHFKYMKPFFSLHDNYQLTKLSLLVNYILEIAEHRNIKVLFTTWDMPTHDLLMKTVREHTMEKIFPNDIDVKKARDLGHPGKMAHVRHAENIQKELYDRSWIQR